MRNSYASRRRGTRRPSRRWWSNTSGASRANVARYLRHSGDVEDVVQEVFIRAHRGLASFRGDSAFFSWLYRIATNAALTHLKRDPGDVQLGDDAQEERGTAFEPGVSDAADPERTLMAKQIAETVQKALSRLQPDLA